MAEHFTFFRNVHTLKLMDKKPFLTQTILQTAKEDDLDFILNEAKERLKTTMDIADNLTNRSITLFTVVVAALIAAIGYIATHFCWCPNTIVLVPICLMLWFICSILRKNIVPNEYFATGADPYTIAVDGMFNNLEGKTPKFHLLVHLIDAYNERILFNRKENETKATNFEDALWWVYAIPIVVIISYLIFFFLSKLFC